MHDAILTTMNDVVISDEMAVRSIIGLSGYGTNGIAQNHDRSDCTRNTYKTPLESASNRLGLKIEQDEKIEPRYIGNSENGNFRATKLNYD